jgi:thioredoxin 1
MKEEATMAANANVIVVDDASFEKEVLESEVPVLVEFSAPWCGPCRAMAPVVERFSTENAGRVKVVAMDTDQSPRTAQRFGIRAVPTLVVFRKGQRTAGHTGTATKEKLTELVGH